MNIFDTEWRSDVKELLPNGPNPLTLLDTRRVKKCSTQAALLVLLESSHYSLQELALDPKAFVEYLGYKTTMDPFRMSVSSMVQITLQNLPIIDKAKSRMTSKRRKIETTPQPEPTPDQNRYTETISPTPAETFAVSDGVESNSLTTAESNDIPVNENEPFYTTSDFSPLAW